MSLEKLKSAEEGESNIRDRRLLMAAVLSMIFASGCRPEEKKFDKDLAGVESGPDTNNISKEYLMPITERDTDIIICEDLDLPDSGQAEPDRSFQELYERVVEASRLKNGRIPNKRK